jgi:hypothetical protein
VNCREVRFEIGADPNAPLTAAAAEHLGTCADCTQYRREMQSLEKDLRLALGQPLPESSPGPAVTASRWGTRFALKRQWAIAASLIVIGSALLVWSVRPTTSLAADVVAHVAAEPWSWEQTAPIPPAEVDAILRRAGVWLDGNPNVVYARTCQFRGREVPHLVVWTAAGRFTVMVLPEDLVGRPEHFRESGYSGVLIPQRGGTLAILGLHDAGVDTVAPQVARAVRPLR